MSDANANPKRTAEDHLKLIGLVLGLLSTSLGLWVAVKTNVIDAAVAATRSTADDIKTRMAVQEERLKSLSLKNMEHDARVQLRLNWVVMPANAFAQTVKAANNNLAWTDTVLQEQLVREADQWLSGRYLMGRTADKALLLRQVVCLEIANVGGTPAAGLRIVGATRDFAEARAGVDDVPFGKLQTPGVPDAAGAELGTLVVGAQSRAPGTEFLIPLAQVVGPSRYVGRLIVPHKIVWRNERLDKEESLPVDVASMALETRLKAAYLGHSLEDGAAAR